MNVHTEIVDERFGSSPQCLPIQSPGLPQFGKKDVFKSSEVRGEACLLGNKSHTGVHGLSRGEERNLLAVKPHQAAIGPVKSRQDSRKGTFARSIRADERVYLSGTETEIYTPECMGPRKSFFDAACGQEFVGRRSAIHHMIPLVAGLLPQGSRLVREK
jgi:hypothetical protein